MAKRHFTWLLFAVTAGAFPARAGVAQSDRPRLVVVLSVDQMRADYLTRFADLFTEGIARLTAEGTVFTEAHQDHAFTATAPGHAALVTGVYANRNGIVNNDWWDRISGRSRYAVEDDNAPIVGSPALPGRSPSTLLAETVGDWLKTQSPASKVFSVAIKDRVAVLMGGHKPDGAYWYDFDTGRYVTSEYYRSQYPEWVKAFNEVGADRYRGVAWAKSAEDEVYARSREDDFPAEDDSVNATFPHLIHWEKLAAATATGDDAPSVDGVSPYQELSVTPFGDELTLAFARQLVIHEELGTDDVPDLLFIGASSADLIGHEYGPYSQEIEDYYLRFDHLLGEYLSFLDEHIGRDRYDVALVADHGIVMMPEEASRRGVRALRVTSRDFANVLREGLLGAMEEFEVWGQPSLQLIYPLGLVITFADPPATEEQMRGVRERVAAALAKAEVIAEVYTYDDLLGHTERDGEFLEQYRRSFHPDRAADVVIRFRKNDQFPGSPPGNHGSPYRYDTHIPMVFWGAGLSAETVGRRVRAVDLAPTVASILGIQSPEDLEGTALQEVVP